MKRKPVLLEEVIQQSEAMAVFNADSVNTVRAHTFNTRDGIVVPLAALRTGRKGSFVDNAALGGIVAAVDTKNGIVSSDGGDEHGNRYSNHPDSGIPFRGAVLPNWEQAIHILKEAASLTPNLKYLSWDLAHTVDHGWVVVEVNTSGQFLCQGGALKGIKSELRELMTNMDLLTSYKLRD